MAFLKVANLGLAFLVSIALARTLAPAGYGQYTFVMSIITLVTMLACLGVPQLVVREVARYRTASQWSRLHGLLQTASRFSLLLSLVLMVVLVLVALTLRGTDPVMYLQLLVAAPMIPLLCLIRLRSAILRGLRLPVLGSFPEMLVKPALMVLAVYVIAQAGALDSTVAIVAQLAATLTALIILSITLAAQVKARLTAAPPVLQVRQWAAALPSFAGIAIVSYLNVEFITLFLGFVSDTPDIAMYRTAVSLAMIVSLPMAAVEAVIAPYITKFYFSGDTAKLQYFAQSASLLALLASLVPAGLLIFFGKQLITVFYGGEYLAAYSSMVIIVVGLSLVNLVGLSMLLLYSTEYQGTALKLAVVGAIMTVLVCIFTIPRYGAVGAAIAFGFGKFARALLFVYFARKKLGFKTTLLY